MSTLRTNNLQSPDSAGVNIVMTEGGGAIFSGIVTAPTLNVTGVLTYDDVTNIDSVGIITARNGLRVTGDAVISHTGANPLDLYKYGTTAPTILMYGANGTAASPTQTLTGDVIGGWNAFGYGSSGFAGGPSVRITAIASENNGQTSNRGADIKIETVATTGTSLQERLRVGSDGKLTSTRTSTTAYDSAATTNDSGFLLLNNGAVGHATLQFQSLSGGTAQTGQATISSFNETAGSKNTALTFGTRQNSDATIRERLRIDSSGNASIANGNLVLSTSGTGIDFSANTNLTGMTGEVLDHYETGTYVPTWTNVASNPINYRNGIDNGTTSNGLSYVRVGKQVTVTGAAFWSGTSINNTRPNMSLPFQARTYTVSGTIANYSLGVASEIHYLNYQTTTEINFFVQDSGGGHTSFGDNSSGEMYFNITYMTY